MGRENFAACSCKSPRIPYNLLGYRNKSLRSAFRRSLMEEFEKDSEQLKRTRKLQGSNSWFFQCCCGNLARFSVHIFAGYLEFCFKNSETLYFSFGANESAKAVTVML